MRKLFLGAVLAAAVFGGTAHAAVEPKAVVATYSDLALAGYEDSLTAAKTLRTAINALVAKPSPETLKACLLYTSPSPRDRQKSRMPSSA